VIVHRRRIESKIEDVFGEYSLDVEEGKEIGCN
jgi:hypothetical protein